MLKTKAKELDLRLKAFCSPFGSSPSEPVCEALTSDIQRENNNNYDEMYIFKYLSLEE